MKQTNTLKKGLIKTTSWVLAHASWLTMTFSPVAMGKEAEKKSVEYYKQYVREIGLDKKMTVQQFWNKVKNDLPGYAYYEIEQAVKNNPDALMPEFQVKPSKASDGSTIPVITFNENGKTNTVQIYGEKDKFLKFNNTFVSETEAKQPAVLFQKLIDSDAKLSQKYKTELVKQARLNKTNSYDFSSMDKNLWKKMTMQQRVSYFIQMRLMYIDAKKVIELNEQGNKKTSSFNYLDMIFKSLFTAAEAQKTQLLNGKSVTISDSAKSCIVAGYVGKYVPMVNNVNGQKRPGCSVEVAIASYNEKAGLDYVVSANKTCKQTKGESSISCNPVLYGYPSGNPICIDKSSKEFQIATHFEGPCDMASRLSYGKNVVDTSGKDYSKIAPPEAQLAAIAKDQATQDYELSKQFIAGVLTSKDESLLALFKEGTWSQALEDEIKRMGSQFDTEIELAIKLCEKDFSNKIDKNQKGACDQLHRRKLFYTDVISKLKKAEPVVTCPAGTDPKDLNPKDPCTTTYVNEDKCPAGTTMDPNDPDMCICSDKKGEKQSFKFDDLKSVIKTCVKPVDENSCPAYPPLKSGRELNADCTCKNKEGSDGNIPKEDQPNLWAKIFNNKTNKQFKKPQTEDGTRTSKNKSSNNDQKREYSCKFGPNWWAVGAAGLGVGALVALLLKKPKTNTVTNTVVENTTTNNPICKDPPKTYWTGSTCTCAPCGVYYMADGSSQTITPNPLTCACAAPPTEGGSGSNTSEGGSGGVPVTNPSTDDGTSK